MPVVDLVDEHVVEAGQADGFVKALDQARHGLVGVVDAQCLAGSQATSSQALSASMPTNDSGLLIAVPCPARVRAHAGPINCSGYDNIRPDAPRWLQRAVGSATEGVVSARSTADSSAESVGLNIQGQRMFQTLEYSKGKRARPCGLARCIYWRSGRGSNPRPPA